MNTSFRMFIILGIGMSLHFLSCTDNGTASQGACNGGFIEVKQVLRTSEPFTYLPFTLPLATGDNVFYLDLGSRIQFIHHYQLTNICCKEHLNVEYQYQTKNEAIPTPISIEGEIVWFPFTPSEKKKDTTDFPQHFNVIHVAAGLSQVFGDKPGNADLYMTVEFDNQGSLNLNKKYFSDHIDYLTISTKASKWAP